MAMPLPRFAPGDPVAKALDATFLNNVVDRLNAVTSRRRTVKESVGPTSTVECFAINNTSGVFAERSIVAQQATLGLTVSSDQEKIRFQSSPLLNIDVPSASTDFPLICLEPIAANGGIGRVAIGGIAVCTVNVTSTGHQYANPTAGDETRLTSAASGQVRILWKDSGTGNKTAVVYLVEYSAASGGTGVDVDTYDDLEIPTAWTFSFDQATCTMTATPTLTTYRWSLTGNTGTGLTLAIAEAP